MYERVVPVFQRCRMLRLLNSMVSEHGLSAQEARLAVFWWASIDSIVQSHLRLKIRGRWLSDLNRQKKRDAAADPSAF